MGCGLSCGKSGGVVTNSANREQQQQQKNGAKKVEKKDIDEFEERTIQPLPEKRPEDKIFKLAGPTFTGEEVIPCFDNGLLYRIVKDDVWAFYNDTRTYEMHVGFTFNKGSTVRPLGNTKVTNLDGTEEYLAELVVYPGETVKYVRGSFTGFKSKINALPLSEEYLKTKAEQYGQRIEEELVRVREMSDDCTTEDDILAKCVRLRIPFVDTKFPPCQDSIAKGSNRPMKVLPWARQDMYLPDGYAPLVRLFRNKINALNIDQGDLGDCWVTCAIATLAENPFLVRRMFSHPVDPEITAKERAVGAHRVTFNKNGWWQNVIVDNYLPVVGGVAKYARSANDPCEMWVSMMEKAYAKLHGSYANIIAGDPLLALQDLSGYPTTRYDESLAKDIEAEDTELLERLERYNRQGFFIVLSTPVKTAEDEEKEKLYKEAGLLMGFGYSVTSVVHIPEDKISLMQIRNPWVKDVEWKGDWNDSDPKWETYPRVAAACGYPAQVEGCFWMSWKDVQKYFNGCGVVFTHPHSKDYRIRGSFNQGIPDVCVQFTVKKKTYIACTLSQEDHRGKENAPEEYPPIMLTLSSGKGSTSEMQVEQNSNLDADHPTNQFTFMQSRDVGMLCTLTPENSPYLLIPRMMSDKTGVPYVLGLFCDDGIGSDVKVEFQRIPEESAIFNNKADFSGKGKSTVATFQVHCPEEGFPKEFSGKEITQSMSGAKKSDNDSSKKSKKN
ncbi:calpain cysteine peptidase [Trypanosoma theileri]|uniref:Calpain cysteine peptidase n=1 Tax=Trypanosoma theileri TaxID=67003 RepID=A0A1X0NWW1_9TRYP|nr:calpain cysteine peptidase [Trypanosoma theileri]ORC88963.1 calpain cysteine peptidase [Trypanosoma theileri]